MECDRLGINLEASQPSETKYSVMHWEEGGRGEAGLRLVQLGPQGFLNPFT